jgi:hypothetical protein
MNHLLLSFSTADWQSFELLQETFNFEMKKHLLQFWLVGCTLCEQVVNS